MPASFRQMNSICRASVAVQHVPPILCVISAKQKQGDAVNEILP